jgi:LuxR family transcriptional regulator, maltose regulon positive regulatory protein
MSPPQTAARQRQSTSTHGDDERLAEGQTGVPRFRRGLVRRPLLVDRLIDADGAQLAVIVAPPGYGKSSLLSEWAERDERPFVWITLEAHETAAEAAISRSIIDALVKTGWIDPAASLELHGSGVDGLAALMSAARSPGSFVLALDDCHLVAPRVLRKVVTACMTALPTGSTVAVASRNEPSLPIGRLRAHRELVEVRMADLAMTPAEAASLLRGAGLDLEFEQIQALVRRTEGWPAALYLAAISIGERPSAGASFAGDDHLLAEYLRDDVLSAVPAELHEFLIRTSVLDELSGPVCDELLEQQGSAQTLAKLADTSQLLVALDPAHRTYRWQRLFGESLRSELRRLEPGVERRLQGRASAWHARRGEIDQAIKHAVAAGDPVDLGDLLWANIVSYLAHGRRDDVERWLGNFSPETIVESGSLALCAAHSALSSGDINSAQQLALAAAAKVGRGRRGQRRNGSPATGLAVIEALVARTGTRAMRDAALRAYELEADGSEWRPALCFLRGVAEHLTGDADGARRLLQEGADLGAARAPAIAALCLAVDAMIAIEHRDWGLATDLTDRAQAIVDERHLDRDPQMALVYASSAAARAHDGRSDEAKRDLRRGSDLLVVLGDFTAWYGAEARILLGHASLWLADIVGARTLLAEASRLARRTPEATIFERWFDEAWAYMDTVAEESLSGPSALTIAELRILRFLPSHRSFREIALQLGVSANTVKTQAHAVYRKLGAASRSEAVLRASEAGLLGQ